MSSVLNSKFSYRFDAPVWETKSAGNYLLINTRDNDALESKFALIDTENSELKWEGLQFEDEWWVSAYHMTDSMVVFQKFEDSQNIDDRTVFGFDLESRESLWSIENVRLTGANGDQLYLNHNNDEQLIFNVRLQEWEEVESSTLTPELVKYPIHYEAEIEHFDTLARFLKLKIGVEMVGSCDYLECQGLIFIAANHVNEGKKTLTLYVFDEQGSRVLQQEVETEVKGLVSGAFFIVKDALIFVTGKNELKIYNIDEKD